MVWITKSAPLHVARWGTYVTSEVKAQSAKVVTRATIQNDSEIAASFRVEEKILSPEGKPVATSFF